MAGILRVDQANVDYIYAKTAGGRVYIPGHIIQVVQTVVSNRWVGSSSNNTWNDITGMSCTITPTYSTSKILVQVFMNGGPYNGVEKTPWRLVRGATPVGIGDSGLGGRATGDCGGPNQYWPPFNGANYMDSPATTSSTTYKLQYNGTTSSYFYLNYPASARGSVEAVDATTISTITLMEIAQ